MKQFSKVVAIVAALVMACAFTSCKNLTNEDDGNSTSKLNAPTNLVINSMTDNTYSCDVNITFNYDGKTGLDGATNAVLGYATTNDSSKAVYDTYNTNAKVEAGSNTRTVSIPSTDAPYLVPGDGKTYYFWLKVTSAANNVSDSAWSNVAQFTYTK
jgi:hypothetical protein